MIAQRIINILNEFGYIVDVIDWFDTTFKPIEKYELFIGHGGCNFKHISRRLPQDVVRIYFSTGLYWKTHNKREKERFHRLRERRGVKLPYDRLIYYSEEYANRRADGIICLGNHIAKESYSKFKAVFNINNAIYPVAQYEIINKNYALSKNNYLFFSGSGNVHKGLDLLIEAFINLNEHLYICQEISNDFYKVYQNELKNCPNIHLIGRIPMRSSEFYDLVEKCSFIIFPSCAEGQPGSVIECMHHGLIPIVSKESNINTDNFGITLKTCSIKEIIEVIQYLSQQSAEWCKDMSQQTRNAAITKYSVENFEQNMRSSIQDIVIQKRK